MADNFVVDFNALFSTVQNWELDFTKYETRNILKEPLAVLLETVDTELVADGQIGAEDQDRINEISAINFCLRNRNLYTIADFQAVLDHTQSAYQDLNSVLHKAASEAAVQATIDKSKQDLLLANGYASQLSQLQNELKTTREAVQTRDHSILKQNQRMKQLAQSEEQARLRLSSFEQQSQNSQSANDSFSSFSSINSSRSSSAIPGTFGSGGNATNATGLPTINESFATQANPNHNIGGNAFSASNSNLNQSNLERTLEKLTLIMDKEKQSRIKISVKPPVYNRKSHGSMLSFGVREFAMWALTQAITPKESTLFFCMCFEKRVQLEYATRQGPVW